MFPSSLQPNPYRVFPSKIKAWRIQTLFLFNQSVCRNRLQHLRIMETWQIWLPGPTIHRFCRWDQECCCPLWWKHQWKCLEHQSVEWLLPEHQGCSLSGALKEVWKLRMDSTSKSFFHASSGPTIWLGDETCDSWDEANHQVLVGELFQLGVGRGWVQCPHWTDAGRQNHHEHQIPAWLFCYCMELRQSQEIHVKSQRSTVKSCPSLSKLFAGWPFVSLGCFPTSFAQATSGENNYWWSLFF